jgi:hypothetical protein
VIHDDMIAFASARNGEVNGRAEANVISETRPRTAIS